ncbi:MAG: hypothetical protein E2O39_07060 [Planctomycetota bacterium]|nr:MAG: hypothetical protein E2O39_07060 [Planctomycetota bacterium]
MRDLRVNKTGLAAVFAMLVMAPSFGAIRFADDEDDKDKQAEGGKEGEEDEDADEWFALLNAEVHTGTGSILRGASILAKNGRIEEIGYDLHVPDDAEVLDAGGMRAYPGLVAISSSGLFGGTSDLENTVDPYGRSMVLALASGITTAVQGNQAGKLKRGEVTDVVASSEVFVSLTYSKGDPRGKRTLREKFDAAAEYIRAYRQWEKDVKKDKELKAPKKPSDSATLKVLRGEVRAKFRANERTDLLEIARLATRYGFRPVIEGCAEGWTVADELGRAGAYAIVTPRSRRTKDEKLTHDAGSSIENAAILHRAGVQVAIVPGTTRIDLGGIVGRDIIHLPIEAGFAVRGGLPESAAFAAITIVPARMMGLSHRIGTLEVGKDCDLIVADGDVLHYQTFVQWAVVDGKIVYDKADELFFAHIRPRPESALAPETKVDAGETAVEEPAEAAGDPDDSED